MTVFYRPLLEDLWFRRQMLSDAATMSYNRAWGGTIPIPPERWPAWYARWVDPGQPGRFYRYLADGEGRFVGEAAYHHDPDRGIFLADVIVYAPLRGQGHGSAGLDLLCAQARADGIGELYDDLAVDYPARRLFLKMGFEELFRTDTVVMLKKVLLQDSCQKRTQVVE